MMSLLTRHARSMPAVDSFPRPEGPGIRDVRQARIMIVDDEPLNIAVVQGYLEMDGYTNIVSTDHAPQALPQIGLHLPDVVLLDIQMPHIDGLEILSAIRSDATLSQMPVVKAEPPVTSGEVAGSVSERALLELLFTGKAHLADAVRKEHQR